MVGFGITSSGCGCYRVGLQVSMFWPEESYSCPHQDEALNCNESQATSWTVKHPNERDGDCPSKVRQLARPSRHGGLVHTSTVSDWRSQRQWSGQFLGAIGSECSWNSPKKLSVFHQDNTSRFRSGDLWNTRQTKQTSGLSCSATPCTKGRGNIQWRYVFPQSFCSKVNLQEDMPQVPCS